MGNKRKVRGTNVKMLLHGERVGWVCLFQTLYCFYFLFFINTLFYNIIEWTLCWAQELLNCILINHFAYFLRKLLSPHLINSFYSILFEYDIYCHLKLPYIWEKCLPNQLNFTIPKLLKIYPIFLILIYVGCYFFDFSKKNTKAFNLFNS